VRLLPRQDIFYDLLEQQADNVVALCECFNELIHDFQNVAQKQAAVKELERAGDKLAHELFNKMHATFVTPLDKDDLAALASGLDDIADYVDAAAVRLVLYKIAEPSAAAMQLAELMRAAAGIVAEAVRGLRSLRGREQFSQAFERIHELENQSDNIYRGALGELFNAPGADPIQILKWKEIYERMEMSVDKCEDVANVIEGIVLKYA
jgi:predicted phosphate transport protein (TIGR00153 family)